MKKKIKEAKLPMEFNVGLQKYEPVLPSPRKRGKKIKFKDAWQWLWIILIAIAVFVGVWLLVRKGLV